MSDPREESEDRTSDPGSSRAGAARSLGRAFRSLDRALGGDKPPTPLQKRTARHPLAAGFVSGAAVGLFLAVLDAGLSALPPALVAGVIYGLTAVAERHRQGRLQRRGLWDGA